MAAHATPCRVLRVSFIPLTIESLGSQIHQPYWSPEPGHLPLHNLSPTFSTVFSATVERECCPVAVPLPSNLDSIV